MKKILFWNLSSIIVLLVLVQCKPNTEKTEVVKTEESVVEELNAHQIIVKEVIQANAYTYLLVKETEKEYWIAVPKTEVTIGNSSKNTHGKAPERRRSLWLA